MSVPGMELAIEASIELIRCAQDVKVYRRQCKQLAGDCQRIVETLQSSSARMGPNNSELVRAADELSHEIDQASRKAKEWAAYSRVKSMILQGDIKTGLDSLQRKIDACVFRFHIAGAFALAEGQEQLDQQIKRDRAEMMEVLRGIAQNPAEHSEFREELTRTSPGNIRLLTQTISQELRSLSSEGGEDSGLLDVVQDIRRESSILALSTGDTELDSWPLAIEGSEGSLQSTQNIDTLEPNAHGQAFAIRVKSKSLERPMTIDNYLNTLISGAVCKSHKRCRTTFLACYKFYVSDDTLLNMAINRYWQNTDVSTEERVSGQLEILDILKEWVMLHGSQFIDDTLLYELRIFLEQIASQKGTEVKARDLLLIMERSSTDANDGFTFPERRAHAKEITPRVLAIALTAYEHQIYRKIRVGDCINYLRRGNDRGLDKVSGAKLTNERIISWVKASIVLGKDSRQRANTLKMFIETANVCLMLNNYSSLAAIMTAIRSSRIIILDTHRELDGQTADTRDNLYSFLDTDHHNIYQNATADRAAKKQALPWIASILRRMQDKYNSIVSLKEADPVMMDVDACWELFEEIQNLIQHVAGYELVQKPNDSVLSYVHYKLKEIGKDLEHERRTDQTTQTHANVGQGSRS